MTETGDKKRSVSVNDKEWLQNLKEGDLVYVSQSYGRAAVPEKVVKTTRTQIVLSHDRRFRKVNGLMIGGRCYAHLLEPTKERWEAWQVERLKSKAVTLRNKINIPDTKPELLEFIEVLSKYAMEEKE